MDDDTGVAAASRFRAGSQRKQLQRGRAGAGPAGGWLSRYARRKKLDFFFRRIPRDARILDVGCGEGWVRQWAEPRGWPDVLGIDLSAPADIVGDVNRWPELGLEPHSFDVVIAFEVIEHADMAQALCDLLKPDGMLMATTPVPRLDGVCQALERMGALQPRTSAHSHLVDLRAYPHFDVVDRRVRGAVAQWGVLRPAGRGRPTESNLQAGQRVQLVLDAEPVRAPVSAPAFGREAGRRPARARP